MVEHVTAFVQTNLKVSRKGVLPLIKNFLAGEGQTLSGDENMNAMEEMASGMKEDDLIEKIDEKNMQMRRHINLAKTAQSNQFRTSMDQFDLAAVGTEAVISPSLSSDSKDNTPSPATPSKTSPTSLLSSLITKQEEEAETASTQPVQSCPPNSVEQDASLSSMDPISNPLINNSENMMCPSVDSPLEFLSLPTSGQTSGQESGQGSKVPSYPETPPNSFVMSPIGMGFVKQTQLPSFNSKEMVEKIQQKKRSLNRRRRDTDDDSNEDFNNKADDFAFFNALTVSDAGGLDSSGSGGGGGGRSRAGGSLISPAVPQNSYIDLVNQCRHSPNYDIPSLARADIEERVIEKRSQLEWSSEGSVPYTPQNSYVEGGAGALSMGSLTSFNSAEMVARIRAKQAAMFGSSGRASASSEDSVGCNSPEGFHRSRCISMESPAQAYTPQNSYKDGLGVLDGQGRLPDLNEVAERLSTEKLNHCSKVKHRSFSNSGGESRDEDGLGVGLGVLKPGGRHSSSQSDSQNTMSDVESLMSISTDVGTPSDNAVANVIAENIRADMIALHRKDTGDSDVFTPAKTNDKPRVVFGFSSTGAGNDERSNQCEMSNGNIEGEAGSTSLPSQVGELFSPLDEGMMMEDEVQYYNAAENIVAKSIAAAMGINENHPVENGDLSLSGLSHNQSSCTGNRPKEKEDGDDANEKPFRPDPNINYSQSKLDDGHIKDPSFLSDPSSSDLSSSDLSSLTQEVSMKKINDSEIQESGAKNSGVHRAGVCFSISKTGSDPDDKLAEAALSELAYEWARELIQDVLEDFNLSQDRVDQTSPQENGVDGSLGSGSEDLESRSKFCHYSHSSENVNAANDSSSQTKSEGIVDWSKARNSETSDLSIVITSGDDDQKEENGNELEEDVDAFSIEALDGSVGDFVRDETIDVDDDDISVERDGLSAKYDSDKEDDDSEVGFIQMDMKDSRSSPKFSDDHSPSGKAKPDPFQADRKLSRGLSSSSDSMQGSNERKWSRDTDKSLTILEDEMMTDFPKRKSWPDIEDEDDEETITSFPGRKISLSEDYPRRFSREGELNTDDVICRVDLETDYLPNMDPFQGSLDIFTNETSISKMTDVDREVVEGESFRRVSGHELEDRIKPEDENDEHKTGSSVAEEDNKRILSVVEDFVSKTIATSLESERVNRLKAEESGSGQIGSFEPVEKTVSFPEQSLRFAQASQAVPKKKRIRVSFSEEVMEEDGTKHQISPRAMMHSPPPPPLFEQSHATSSRELDFSSDNLADAPDPFTVTSDERVDMSTVEEMVNKTVLQAKNDLSKSEMDATEPCTSLSPVDSNANASDHACENSPKSTSASTAAGPMPAASHPLLEYSRNQSASSVDSVKVITFLVVLIFNPFATDLGSSQGFYING